MTHKPGLCYTPPSETERSSYRFFDLPNSGKRENIFHIQRSRCGRQLAQFDLPSLATSTQGFRGAEIERALVSALYTGFSDNQGLSTDLIMEVVSIQAEKSMLIVHVSVYVKPDQIEPFKVATVENARHSLEEEGVVRFDVIQQEDDPARFVLIEAYRIPNDPARHKEAAHYQKWRDIVADMMAEPRTSIKYTHVFPPMDGWYSSSEASTDQ